MYDSRRLIQSSRYGFHYGSLPYNAICPPDGNLCPVPFTHHERWARLEIEANPEWKKEFQLAQQNRGYDAKEFLIIVKGYIFINNGWFNFYTKGSCTSQQMKALRCDPYREMWRMEAYFSD